MTDEARIAAPAEKLLPDLEVPRPLRDDATGDIDNDTDNSHCIASHRFP